MVSGVREEVELKEQGEWPQELEGNQENVVQSEPREGSRRKERAMVPDATESTRVSMIRRSPVPWANLFLWSDRGSIQK